MPDATTGGHLWPKGELVLPAWNRLVSRRLPLLIRSAWPRCEPANFTVIMVETYLQHDMSRSMILTVAWTTRVQPSPVAYQNPALDPWAGELGMDGGPSLG